MAYISHQRNLLVAILKLLLQSLVHPLCTLCLFGDPFKSWFAVHTDYRDSWCLIVVYGQRNFDLFIVFIVTLCRFVKVYMLYFWVLCICVHALMLEWLCTINQSINQPIWQTVVYCWATNPKYSPFDVNYTHDIFTHPLKHLSRLTSAKHFPWLIV